MTNQTDINHFRIAPPKQDNRPLVSPIYQSVKFTFESMDELRKFFTNQREGYFYSRYSNPTVHELECLLAKLQGTERGIATASGVAAIFSCLFSILKAGDQVVYFIESYKPTRLIISKILKKFGVTGIRLSFRDHAAISKAFADPKTKVAIFESPSNPMLHEPDLKFITDAARASYVTTILDNTFAGFHKNKDVAVDIYIHSLTKFANGHGDSMGGIILGSNELLKPIFSDVGEFGPTLDPHSAFLILRGMKTYFLRYERQASTAKKIAQFLSEQAQVTKVYYPEPKNGSDGGSVVSFELSSDYPSVDRFIDKLSLFALSASIGSVESLVAPVLYFYGTDLSSEERRVAEISERTIRLSIGLEEPSDLVDDLKQAF